MSGVPGLLPPGFPAAIYQQKLAALEALKESPLHRAFAGRL